MIQQNKLLVTNIQRMCMHDGPGIRTTIFLKGCNLHCPWCANPENISFARETYKKDARVGVYGEYYSGEELLQEILKDRMFYGDDGGVTFSGGEPLMHISRLGNLFEMLKEEEIAIAVETALFVSSEAIRSAIPYVDLFIVDMKILHPQMCKEVLGGVVEDYLKNLELLVEAGKQVLIRIPCNHEYTMIVENQELILEWCAKHSAIPVEIFSTHSLGKAKYESLELESVDVHGIENDELEYFATRLRQGGTKVTINKL